MPNPNTLRLDDGFSTLITFANAATVKLFEKEVTPPGYAAGGAIDTTTMRNQAYRTAAPKRLKSLSALSAVVAYATVALETIWAQIGVLQEITVTFPDGATLSVWGWLDEFTPAAHTEGEQPTATITVQLSMRDDQGAEVAPVYTAPVESSESQ